MVLSMVVLFVQREILVSDLFILLIMISEGNLITWDK